VLVPGAFVVGRRCQSADTVLSECCWQGICSTLYRSFVIVAVYV